MFHSFLQEGDFLVRPVQHRIDFSETYALSLAWSFSSCCGQRYCYKVLSLPYQISFECDLASEGPKNDSFCPGRLEIAFSDRIMAPWRNERRGPLSLSRFGCSFKRIIASRAGASISGPEFQASDRLWLISNVDNLVHHLFYSQLLYLGWPYIWSRSYKMCWSRISRLPSLSLPADSWESAGRPGYSLPAHFTRRKIVKMALSH